MAYGNTGSITSAYLDLAGATVDEWIGFGNNVIDLFSAHAPELAILMDNSMQPGGDYQFRQLPMDGGIDWRIPVFGRGMQGGGAPAGITRANLVNDITPAIPADLTNIKWVRSNYRGMLTDDIVRQQSNAGKEQMVDLGDMMLQQIKAQFFDEVSTDLWDNAAGSESKVQSFNAALANSTTVGGVDQSDADNAWWTAQQDTTAEVTNLATHNRMFDKSTIDTAVPTGVAPGSPDIAFYYGDNYSVIREEIMQMQRLMEYKEVAKGGAKFFEYNGVRFFRNTRQVADTNIMLNSRTWAFRYVTKAPKPITPVFMAHPTRTGIFTKGYFWTISLGTYSPKHNVLCTNKRAA